MYQQAVKRICHGCIDKEAGQYVVNLNLDSVEQVIDKIKSFQLNHQSIYDKQKKEFREINFSSYNANSSEDEITTDKVRKLKQQNSYNPEEKPKMKLQLNELSMQMGVIKDGIFSLLRHLVKMQTKSTNVITKKPVIRSPSTSNARCFHCNGLGHFAKECLQKNTEKKTQLSMYPFR